MARQDQIRVDLVGDDEYPVPQADIRHLLQLPALPHPTHRIVGIAEDQHGGILAAAQLLQQGEVDGVAAIVSQYHRAVQTAAVQQLRRVQKRRIGRGHDHDAVPRSGKRPDHLVHGTQYTVGVDHPLGGDVHAMAAAHPALEGGDIRLRRAGVAKDPAGHKVTDALCQLRRRQKIHIRHGEGNDPPGYIRATLLHQLVFFRAGIPPVRQRGKIIGHGVSLLSDIPLFYLFPYRCQAGKDG